MASAGGAPSDRDLRLGDVAVLGRGAVAVDVADCVRLQAGVAQREEPGGDGT